MSIFVRYAMMHKMGFWYSIISFWMRGIPLFPSLLVAGSLYRGRGGGRGAGGWRDQNLYKRVGDSIWLCSALGSVANFLLNVYNDNSCTFTPICEIHIYIYMSSHDGSALLIFNVYNAFSTKLCLNWCCYLCYTHISQTIGSIHNSNCINLW